jgi:HK97 family phage prohead protease
MSTLARCRHRACPGDPDATRDAAGRRDGRNKPGHDRGGAGAGAPRETKLLAAPLAGVGADGIFEGYASLFEVADLGKDVVAAGAFSASLARRGVGDVRMLWQHDPAEPIGRWLAIAEDARGLRVRGELNLAVARAREIHALMRNGAIDGLSIGFRVERARTDRAGLRRLERLDLWEISVVTFPMMPGARIGAAKSEAIAGAIRRAARRLFAPA